MRFEQISISLLAFSLAVIIGAGCGDAPPSASFQEAQKIHEQLDRLAAELHDELQLAVGDVEVQIEANLAAGDSIFAMRLARVESQLGELDVRFHDWESTVVPLPGATCDHDHAHDHDHDHDHDHAHDHGSGVSLEGMSDEAILEIQQALMAELTQIGVLLKEVKSSLQNVGNEDDTE
jgi:ABC-type nickel/cobalt efflux system permease component RcnA